MPDLQLFSDKSLAGKWRNRLPAGIKMKFAAEADYAKSIIESNELLSKATEDSVRQSLMSCAMVGLSLNPSLGFAYLVPYNNQDKQVIECTLSVSYKGMMNIVERSDEIQWVKAKVVYENEPFEYLEGTTTTISHKIIREHTKRGKMIGAYCIAKLKNNDLAVEYMDEEQIARVKSKAKTNTTKVSSPWVMFPEEMWKKSVVRRAWKYWPKSGGLEALIEVMNTEEGIKFKELEKEEVVLVLSDEHISEITSYLKDNLPDVDHEKWLNRLASSFGQTGIQDISDARFREVFAQLKNAVDNLVKKQASEAES